MTSAQLASAEICPGFKYHELLPRWMCEHLLTVALDGIIDPIILNILQEVRKDLGSVYVNNWYWGGNKQWRGFRTPDSSWYSAGSQHSYGKAVDFNVKGMSTKEVHEHILANHDRYYALGLRRMESLVDAPTWTHMDIKENIRDNIHVFRK